MENMWILISNLRERLFISVLNNAITVSALIIAIIVVRAFGKKMPKWITCMLWIIVAVKLVVPIKLESAFSLVPSAEPIFVNEQNISYDQIAASDFSESMIYAAKDGLSADSDALSDNGQLARENRSISNLHKGQIIWLSGMAAMLIYAFTTYALIRKRVSASIKILPKVYECDNISDSFVLGIINPRVYLPSTLSENAKKYVLKHEFAHISRQDHIWKPLGFAILAIYWFNPLCWIAYALLCKDIEYACDEKVIRNIDKNEKNEYCRVLFENSMPRKMLVACPVTFGGIDVKDRIKNVVNYKKPAFWITAVSVLVCIAVGVCFATNKNVDVYQSEVKNVVENYSEVKEQEAEKLKENTTAEIDDLITEYYDAFNNRDIEGMSRLCRGNVESKLAKAHVSAKYIHMYYLSTTYTNAGPVEGSYVVYATSNGMLRISGEDMAFVPEVEVFYICRDENGELYINCDTRDKVISDYINELKGNPAQEYIYEKADEWKKYAEYNSVEDIILKMREEVSAVSRI